MQTSVHSMRIPTLLRVVISSFLSRPFEAQTVYSRMLAFSQGSHFSLHSKGVPSENKRIKLVYLSEHNDLNSFRIIEWKFELQKE